MIPGSVTSVEVNALSVSRFGYLSNHRRWKCPSEMCLQSHDSPYMSFASPPPTSGDLEMSRSWAASTNGWDGIARGVVPWTTLLPYLVALRMRFIYLSFFFFFFSKKEEITDLWDTLLNIEDFMTHLTDGKRVNEQSRQILSRGETEWSIAKLNEEADSNEALMIGKRLLSRFKPSFSHPLSLLEAQKCCYAFRRPRSNFMIQGLTRNF
jgi:hypothetical protein